MGSTLLMPAHFLYVVVWQQSELGEETTISQPKTCVTYYLPRRRLLPTMPAIWS